MHKVTFFMLFNYKELMNVRLTLILESITLYLSFDANLI